MKKPSVPTCFICRKPVDAMSKSKTMVDQMAEFTVWCHGERETVRIPRELVTDSAGIDYGEAFAPPMLPAPEPTSTTKWFLT